jgi:hypothetical protein
MRIARLHWLILLALVLPMNLLGQTTQVVRGADDRYKVDILVVVAHPDDEGGATPYLARAIYDEHKRVGVVIATRGGSGGNDYAREHGPALANVREIEAREACAKLGITSVWFLDGKDTASQNVLNSLANWGHGANLEKLVGIYRLTRPEVVIVAAGRVYWRESRGPSGSGVLRPGVRFGCGPDGISGAVRGLRSGWKFIWRLTPWQPKKLYFFSDADDQTQFDGSGPTYSIKEISPSQKKPYWRLAMDAATPHLTQFPNEIHQMSAMTEDHPSKFREDPQHAWWTEPMTLIFGKAAEPTPRGQSIFPDAEPDPKEPPNKAEQSSGVSTFDRHGPLSLSLGGPCAYYDAFYLSHKLNFPHAGVEIGVKTGSVLSIPLVVTHREKKPREVSIKVQAPNGWKVLSGEGKFELPDEEITYWRVEIQTPDLPGKELKNKKPEPIIVEGVVQEKVFGRIETRVLLRSSALPQ